MDLRNFKTKTQSFNVRYKATADAQISSCVVDEITTPYLDWHVDPKHLDENGFLRTEIKRNCSTLDLNQNDKYFLYTVLGRGSFGEVYLAQHEKSGEWIAVKKPRLSEKFLKRCKERNIGPSEQQVIIKNLALEEEQQLKNTNNLLFYDPKTSAIGMKLLKSVSLETFNEDQSFSLIQKIAIAKDILKKAAYLHHDAIKIRQELFFSEWKHVAFLPITDVNAIARSILENAKKSLTPILFKTNEGKFLLFGGQKGENNWGLTEVIFNNKELESELLKEEDSAINKDIQQQIIDDVSNSFGSRPKTAIFHLDIKNQNIYLDPSTNTVEHCDFGLSQAVVDPLSNLTLNLMTLTDNIDFAKEEDVLDYFKSNFKEKMNQKPLLIRTRDNRFYLYGDKSEEDISSLTQIKTMSENDINQLNNLYNDTNEKPILNGYVPYTKLSSYDLALLKEGHEEFDLFYQTRPSLAWAHDYKKGTESYQAPEIKQAQKGEGIEYNEQTEVFALGVTLKKLFAKSKCPRDLIKLMADMTNKDSSMRPTVIEATIKLNEIYQKVAKDDSLNAVNVSVINIDDFLKANKDKQTTCAYQICKSDMNIVVLKGSEKTSELDFQIARQLLMKAGTISIAPFMVKANSLDTHLSPANQKEEEDRAVFQWIKNHYDHVFGNLNTNVFQHKFSKKYNSVDSIFVPYVNDHNIISRIERASSVKLQQSGYLLQKLQSTILSTQHKSEQDQKIIKMTAKKSIFFMDHFYLYNDQTKKITLKSHTKNILDEIHAAEEKVTSLNETNKHDKNYILKETLDKVMKIASEAYHHDSNDRFYLHLFEILHVDVKQSLKNLKEFIESKNKKYWGTTIYDRPTKVNSIYKIINNENMDMNEKLFKIIFLAKEAEKNSSVLARRSDNAQDFYENITDFIYVRPIMDEKNVSSTKKFDEQMLRPHLF